MSKSYPYPVLGNGDDINGKFDFSIDADLAPTEITIYCKFDLDHETIRELIENDSAVYMAEVICTATFYRQAYISKEPEIKIIIPAEKLRRQVEVSSFISTKGYIKSYDPAGTHPDLAGGTSDLEAGDITAIGNVWTFQADKDFDAFSAPASSFIKIQRGGEEKGPMAVDYGGDDLFILLSDEDYDEYLSIRNESAAAIFHSSLVLPVLTDVLHSVQKGNEYQDQNWFKRIQQICQARNIDMEDSLRAAQEILYSPVTRGFRSLKNILEVE